MSQIKKKQHNPSFDGKNYQSVESSKHWHAGTGNLANYQGKALTTGCYPFTQFSRYGSLRCQLKTELMDIETETWLDGPDFPFSDK